MITRPTRNRTVQDYRDEATRRESTVDRSVESHIEYGKILEVDLKNCRVKVEKQDGKVLEGATIDGKPRSRFFPLLTPLSEIHLKCGPLVPGLRVSYHWRGKLSPESLVVVNVIGNNNLTSQDYHLPEIERGFSMPVI